jgi:hypothetical protein
VTTTFSQTLCNQFNNISYTYTVGVGSPGNIVNSSQLGFSLPSGSTVNIVGDFNISGNFNLTDAIVKVAPNAKITVQTFNALTLNNTKIFACDGLWQGIDMQSFSSISVTNSSEIEDADNAIKAFNTSFVYLYIDNSIFNRNKIGINIEDSGNNGGWYWFPPSLAYFYNNKFTCTSPLNGSTTAITDIGLRLKNINYPFAFNYGYNYNNEFKSLNNGMVIQSSGLSTISVDNYTFSKIKNKCISFLNGDNLDVRNSRFIDIEKFGIDFTNSKTLTAINNYFEIADRNQSPGGFGRIMIYEQNPKVGNYSTIQNNEFYFVGKMRLLARGIELLEAGGETQVISASISGNSFKQYNDFGTLADPTIYYSVGVNLSGNYAPGSAVNIEGNAFILDYSNTGQLNYNTGVSARFGNKNNVKVIGNTFKAGSGRYCEFVGSTGVGNEFSNNQAVQGLNYHLGGFLIAENVENLKVCSNTDNSASTVTYGFLGQNIFMDFQNNVTYGRYQSSLWITGQGVIGTQEHKGNKWYPAFSQFGSYNHPLVQHETPTLASQSRFRVHTNQSMRVGNTYSFFSEYFPSDIVPNTGLFETISGTPNSSCITQSPGIPNMDPVVDPAIANGTYSRLMNNSVIAFDGQLHLQRKVNRDNNFSNAHTDIKEFSKKNQSNNIGKFVKLEVNINENQGLDNIKKDKIALLKKKIQDLESQTKQKFNAQRRPTEEEVKQYHKQRLDLDMAINDLCNEHKNEKKIKLKSAKSEVDNIIANTTHERYFKEVHQIYLDAQLNNNGTFTAEQIAKLKKIAGTCVTEGGKIVYVARGYLSHADLEEALKSVEICEKRPEPKNSNFNDEPMALKVDKDKAKEEIALYPNPTNEAFYIDIPKGLTAKVDIYDITGRLAKSINATTGSNYIKHRIPQGMYIAKINTSDGQTKAIKFTIEN